MRKSIVIFGSFGKVGEAVVRDLAVNTNYEIIAISKFTEDKSQYWKKYHCDYDILNFREIKKLLISLRPRFIINCAAYTNVDACEELKSECWKLNVDFVETIARASAITNSHLIHFSTDYIFDGRNGPYPENATPNPINFYGKSKLAAENVIKSIDGKFTIIRTNLLFGPSHIGKKTFVDFVFDNLRQGRQINVVDSLFSNPILTTDIAAGVRQIIKSRYLGVINFAGPDYISRYGISVKIADINNFDLSLIQKVDINDVDFLANRPHKAGLNISKAIKELNIKFQDLEHSLREYFSQLMISKESMNLISRNTN